MARLAHISHSSDGYALVVVEVPLWAVVVQDASHWLCHLTGDRLCGANLPEWMWKLGVGHDARDEAGWPEWTLGRGINAVGEWFHTFGAWRERTVYRRPLTVSEVIDHFPDARIPFLET